MSYQATTRQGRNLDTYYHVEEANVGRLHAVCYQQHDIPGKAKLWRQYKYQWLSEIGGGGGKRG